MLRRLFGKQPPSWEPAGRVAASQEIQLASEESGDDFHELSIVGEGPRQEALAAIAGPKGIDGKQLVVGVTLRCEPTNAYDGNAVRVEVMGQHVGYSARDEAALLSPALQRHCGGAIEARGLIVGGWKDGESEGHYGIRVWLTAEDARRLALPAS